MKCKILFTTNSLSKYNSTLYLINFQPAIRTFPSNLNPINYRSNIPQEQTSELPLVSVHLFNFENRKTCLFMLQITACQKEFKMSTNGGLFSFHCHFLLKCNTHMLKSNYISSAKVFQLKVTIE